MLDSRTSGAGAVDDTSSCGNTSVSLEPCHVVGLARLVRGCLSGTLLAVVAGVVGENNKLEIFAESLLTHVEFWIQPSVLVAVDAVLLFAIVDDLARNTTQLKAETCP